MIWEKKKEFKFNCFSEECFKLCSHENRKNDVKCGLKQKKREDVEKLNRKHYHLQKKGC